MFKEDAIKMIEFMKGKIEGIYSYAWMKDGRYYVGTCGTTYKEAIAPIEKEIEKLEQWLKENT